MGKSWATDYLQLLQELCDARKAAGGSLTQEQESEYVACLEELWWKLSEQEQDELEATAPPHK